MTKELAIAGQIVLPDGKPLSGVTVRGFDKDLPSLKARGLDEQRLGADAITDAKGYYRIAFTEDQFRQGGARARRKLRPDLIIRVYDDDTLVGESAVLYNAPDEATIDLIVTVPDRSEFELLVSRITPVLQGVALADLSDEDVAFLKGETGTDPERQGIPPRPKELVPEALSSPTGETQLAPDALELLRTSAQLARQTRLPTELFYGLAREARPLVLDQLLATPDDILHSALASALDHRIIPAALRDQIESMIQRLKRHNYVPYTATGQLIDQTTGAAVSQAGFKVHVFDVNGAAGPIDLGIATTDGKGLFSFGYSGPPLPAAPALTAVSLRFQLKIADSKSQALDESEVSIGLGQKSTFQVSVSVPAPIPQPSAAITDVLTSANAEVPPELQTFLAGRNIHTLSDIRRAGGLSLLADLPLAPDHPAVMTLEAHADLSRLSADVSFTSKLIDKGYSSVAAIADAPQALFVSAIHSEIGDFKAAQLHALARAQAAFLDNVLAGAAAAQANGFTADVTAADGSKLFSDSCACEDCESAVSPAIYLADLLDYATKSVTQNPGPLIDLAFLSNTLHQPFGDLSISCEAVTQSVRRVRICVEVLRGYLGARPLANATKETDLESAEKTYLVSAYTTLLNQIGTSYEEIRLARTATEEQRQALADRLGIDLTVPRPAAPGDELDRLFLDLSVVVGSAGSIAALRALERDIEGLFGLADTTRDPLSDGAKFGDEKDELLSRWQLRNAEWGRNTDLDGDVFLTLEKPSPTEASILKVYNDSQRRQLVAATIGAGNLLPRNGSGLRGTISFGLGGAGIDKCVITAIPNFLSWRLKHLRTLWMQQDHPPDAYSPGGLPLLVRPLQRSFADAGVKTRAMAIPTRLSDASAVTVQVDATRLAYREFLIPGFSGWLDARTPQSLQLEPGTYSVQFASGYYADFTFSVTAQGTIDYPASFDAFLSGRGGTTLVMNGFEVTLDARSLSGSGVLLAEMPATSDDWISLKTLRLLPASWYTVQQSSGELAELAFAVRLDGTISYQPALDVANSGCLAGAGTATLRFVGYPIQIDAMVLGAVGVTVFPVWGMPFSTSGVQIATLLPAPLYWLWSFSGSVDGSTFHLSSSGVVTVDNNSPNRLQVVTLPSGGFGLKVLPPQSAVNAPTVLPLIDPDLIGADDFRVPFAKANAGDPDGPFDLWLARRGVVDKALAKLQKDREANDLAFILSSVFNPLGLPIPNFDALLQDLTQGDKAAVTRAKDGIVKLNLTVDSFTRLMALRAKDAQATEGPGEAVSPDEWGEVYSILTQVEKVRLFRAWRDQEQQLQTPLILGMQDFWLSLREPAVGEWPIAQSPGVPLIDPDLVTLKDLPEGVAGSQAIQLWNDRWVRLKRTIPAELASTRSSNGFDAMVFQALGTPPGTPLPSPDNLDTLRTRLASSNQADVSAAQVAITNDLHLTLDAFSRLMAIRDKDAAVDPGKKPTAAEYTEVYAILTKARKLKTEYASWAAEESAAFGQEGGVAGEPVGSLAYWRARKAALPRWRASAEARQNWRQAQQARSAPPIIDPDLIDAFDLRDPISGNAAFALWEARSIDVAERISAITMAPPSSTSAFDQLLGNPDYLGIGFNTVALDDLDRDRSQGHSIQRRLDQLELTYPAFDTLLRVSKLVVSGQTILASEWSDVASILVQCYKRKRFAAWRLEEPTSITFGPDFFQVRPLPTDLFSPVSVPKLSAFRATADARRAWDDTLQSRIDEQTAVVSGMRDAVTETEIATLAPLRDALIQASDAPFTAKDLGSSAKWLAQKLLIDFQAGTCQTVTRIEQAIETMQSLFYALRTGLGGEQLLPPLVLAIDTSEFDQKWKWLGSYATWRSAMLVFLYPETLLLPTLRPDKWQTPGFRDLVKTLSRGGSLNPEAACQAVGQYAAYFRDVCGLIVEATCHSLMTIPVTDGCNGPVTSETHEAFFMFARSSSTNRVYWSVYDLELRSESNGTDFAQSYWTEIKHDALKDVIKLIGAVPFKQGIYLFAHTKASETEKLVALVLDTSNQELKVAIDDLKPSGATSFIAAVLQDPNVYSIASRDPNGQPPSLGIQSPDGSLYFGHLNKEGLAWADGNPRLVGHYKNPLLAIVQHGKKGNSIVVVPSSVQPESVPPDWEVSFLPGIVMNGATEASYHGLIWLPEIPEQSDGSGLMFFIFCDFGGSARVFTLYVSENLTFNGFIAQIEAIVPSGGSRPLAAPNQPYQFVYLRRPDGVFRRCTFAYINDEFISKFVYMDSDNALAPDVEEDLRNIPPYLSSSDLQKRRQHIGQTFQNNSSYPESLRTYLEEAFYFVPMHVALQLQRSGEYEGALGWFRTVYDYTARDQNERKIYYGLKQEESLPEVYQWSTNWLSDALNPHAIAKTRRNAYTKYTLFCIIRCLLDYADSEFSQDTGESVARARALYEEALELLHTDALNQSPPDCATIIGDLALDNQSSSASGAALAQLRQTMKRISDAATLRQTAIQILRVLKRAEPASRRFADAGQLAADAAEESSRAMSLSVAIGQSAVMRKQRHLSMIANRDLEKAVETVGNAAGADLVNAVSRGTGLAKEKLEGGDPIDLPWLRMTGPSVADLAADTTQDRKTAVQVVRQFQSGYVPSTIGLWGCIPQHPILNTLRLHAEVNLRKMRTCRNIAGMKRDLDPYAAPTNTTSALPSVGMGSQLSLLRAVTIQPTLYRYSVLIDRAKQLVQTAAQIESQMLSALEKFDDKSYGVLRARQDLSVTTATVQLQVLKVSEANDRVTFAGSQRDRVTNQISYFAELLAEPESGNDYEQGALLDLDIASNLQEQASNETFQGGSVGISGIFGSASLSFSGTQQTLEQASSLTTAASASQLRASFERRRREWQYQSALANQDAVIADDQIGLAKDEVGIATQEKSIADLQQSNAAAALNFLTTSFTNPDLYSWMAGVLQDVYGFFLRQGTAMARLAENQLGFERQQVPTGYILADYWAIPSNSASPNSTTTADRKGLTGAERLLEDIAQLDQFAFLTDTRKLQLSQTFSLSRLSPAEFQRFRETGVMTFSTPMELFDRRFPGHYLRLVKRVKTSVVALIPPNEGIAAALSSTGLSRVAIGGDIFQTVAVRRDPESVALTSPVNATGILDLVPQADTMLLPFEDTGVDTTWELRMEKASNLFDYSTIADVLVTIDYTALNSFDYRQQVIQSLSPTISADRPYSFRNQFADQWYDLHNPDQAATPMTVRFTTFPEDFPPNIDDLRIQQVLLYFSRADGKTFEISVSSLRFKERGAPGAVGGGATSIDGTISTRRGNAGSWSAMLGKTTAGEWELTLPDSEEMRARFAADDIQDILFVITYSGRTAEWVQ